MTVTQARAPDASEERKRLGQFFTGERIARLLAALAEADRALAIVDPMAGSGDMLVAARQVGAHGATLQAVEIDPEVGSRCARRLEPQGQAPAATTIGDAFSPATWALIEDQPWDLVITNPPYVRYQRTAHRAAGRVPVPSAAEVRRGLLETLANRASIDPGDRDIFRALAAEYSGLSDLAVPAWLVCASLVATGGRLAMVVPDTWLSRDYSGPILYLLRRFFDVEYVVADGQAAWFEDALVRPTLLVARRVGDRTTALHEDDTGYLHIRLDAAAGDRRSVVGALHGGALAPERDFARDMAGVRRSRGAFSGAGVAAQWMSDEHFRDFLVARMNRAAWLSGIEPRTSRGSAPWPARRPPAAMPPQVREIASGAVGDLRTLSDYGWQVGQGLRTGANRFFYGEVVQETGGMVRLAVDPALRADPLPVPQELLRRAVRKQQDLAAAHGIASETAGRLLVLGDHALQEDIDAAERILGRTFHRRLPEPLAEHVRRAAALNVGTAARPRPIPELSAVVTNIRPADPRRPDRAPRFWYQLPALAPRHVPELLIPRVNHGHALTSVNPDRVIIDANFSTMWRQRPDALSPLALLAILHSTWAITVLEAIGTVLGAGALKIEATQLRRLPLPQVDGPIVGELAEQGDQLAAAPGLACAAARRRIDEIIWDALTASSRPGLGQAVGSLGRQLLKNRSPRLSEVL